MRRLRHSAPSFRAGHEPVVSASNDSHPRPGAAMIRARFSRERVGLEKCHSSGVMHNLEMLSEPAQAHEPEKACPRARPEGGYRFSENACPRARPEGSCANNKLKA